MGTATKSTSKATSITGKGVGPLKASVTSGTTNSVKALQRELNKAGANLKVDGIAGPKTLAAQAKYGTSGSTTGGTTKTTTPAGTSKSSSSISKTTGGGGGGGGSWGKSSGSSSSTKSSTKQKTAVGGILSNIGSGFKNALTNVKKIASKQPASAINALDFLQQSPQVTANAKAAANVPISSNTMTSFSGGTLGGGKNMTSPATSPVVAQPKQQTYAEYQAAQNLKNMESSSALAPGQNGGSSSPYQTGAGVAGSGINLGTPAVPETTNTGDTSSTTVQKTRSTDALGNPVETTQTLNTTPTTQTTPMNYGSVDGASKAIMGINADLKSLKGEGSVWNYDNGKMLINNRVKSWTDNIANNFKTPADFDTAMANPNFAASFNTLGETGITPESIKAKIQLNATGEVNGIKPPQSTAEYLDSMVSKMAGIPEFNSGDKTMDANLRTQALLEKGYTDEYIAMLKGDHDTVGILERDKVTAEQTIEQLTEKEADRENSVRERADYAIDKAKAEWQKADAEIEINRINAKNSMIGLLASLGALDTSGSAGLAIATLDNKYQAQRQELQNNFNMGVREIKMDMNDKIMDLEDQRDDSILKINSDLSKSEREINLEIMKLNNDIQKSMLSIKMKADEKLAEKKEKAAAKAESLSNDWTNRFFTATAGDYFKSLPKEFVAQWMTNAPSWGAGTTSNKTGLTGKQGLMQDFANWSKNNPSSKNYTAANIPDDILTSLQEDIEAGAPLDVLISLYPEVSTSYLNSFYNQYSQ